MKKVLLGLDDYTVSFFSGEKEYEAYRRLYRRSTGDECPKLNKDRRGSACMRAIWVLDKYDVAIIAHELIHCLLFIYDHIGACEESPKELFAYQHTYLMKSFIGVLK